MSVSVDILPQKEQIIHNLDPLRIYAWFYRKVRYGNNFSVL